MNAIETTFNLRDGMLAAKIWGPEKGAPVIACHGWLDNASSFDGIAPLLKDHRVICIDFAGHGLSAHRPRGPLYQIADLAWDVVSLVQHLQWERFSFIGHSLGAVVGSLVAASFPERLNHLICMDALGPLTLDPHRAPLQLRHALIKHAELHKKQPPTYKTIDEAIFARANHSGIKLEALRPMVLRGLKQTPEGLYTWRTDPQLMNPSAIMMTEELALSFLGAITTKTMFMRPADGLEFGPNVLETRINAVKNMHVEIMEGHHHQHLESPEIFASLILNFLNQ